MGAGTVAVAVAVTATVAVAVVVVVTATIAYFVMNFAVYVTKRMYVCVCVSVCM